MPGFIKPQLATLKSKAPKGEQWIHEVKYDGYRVQVHVNPRDGTRAPYRSERVEAWLKVKCVTQANSRLSDSLKDPTGVTALYLGKPEGKELVYMGKVGQDGLAPSPAKSGSNSKP
jgi:ATP-dependent DNA ligase